MEEQSNDNRGWFMRALRKGWQDSRKLEARRVQIARRFWRALWLLLDTTRRVVVNLAFLALIVALIVVAASGGGPEVPETTALVLSPKGVIVEQLAGQGMQRAVDEIRGTAQTQTLLRDLLDAIAIARDDDRVQVLLLDLNRLRGAGLTKLQDLRDAIAEFKTSGKRVIATSDGYANASYYLAAQADEIYMHHMGIAMPEGFGRYRRYYKDAIDRLEVDYNVFRVGTYKSAVEPYLRSGMSEEAKQANLEWLNDLWSAYLADVSAARGISPEVITDYIKRANEHLEQAQGNPAQAALDAGLVDFVGDRDLVRERLIELVGEDEETHSFYRIGHEAYLEANEEERDELLGSGNGIGVIVAAGTILDGSQPPGRIGGDSTAALIRQARHDDSIKAVVLRVDSGGGSAFASEVIRRELELIREAGKPVVVSMGSVAASGGYWITMSSDEVWTHATTITGSIGIFGMIPTFQKPLAKHLGVRVDGVGTTWMAGGVRIDRELDPRLGEAIQRVVENGYQDFVSRVAEARSSTPQEIDVIAQGRVWSGEDAHRLGLVDELGGLDEAIASAAQKAGLDEGYRITYVEKKLGFKDRVIRDLFEGFAARFVGETDDGVGLISEPGLTRVMRALTRQAETLAELNDPNGLYAYCMDLTEVQ